ncbi:hypothetical protein MLD38_009749 [Melastoma candidum]|uniref:Uncharacterized protein n=1 Tax=Melastoma candidum TaxID=119954 RepID=A0ACB9RZV0_9MYRT|nr:hypothetical protein MLD38_009749 [Melastoma candidum]
MVLKKGFQSRMVSFDAPVPRAPRSARRRSRHNKISDGKHHCPIELLASLAGKLLQENESSSASNNASDENNLLAFCKDRVKEERQHVDKPLKVESLELGSCEESNFVVQHELECKDQQPKQESQSKDESDHSVECTSVISDFVPLDKGKSDTKPMVFNNVDGIRVEGTRKSIFKDLLRGRNVATNNDRIKLQKPSCRDPSRMTYFSRHRTDINLFGRDDDEKFSRMNKCSNRLKSFRYHQRVGDHRIRKLLSSKCWRAAPKLKDYEFSKSDCNAKPMLISYKRKAFHKWERYQDDCLYKKRKLFDRSSIVTTDVVVSGESNSNLPTKSVIADKDVPVEEGGTSASISGSQAALHVKDTNVKLSIKSFKIPELFIDVPQTATVGSLKRTIIEAITAILGSGLRVGVVLHGKKIRDDGRTLLQSGLCCQENLENLGFTLEPTLENPQQATVGENPPLMAPCDAPNQLTSVCEAIGSEIGVLDGVGDQPLLTHASDHIVDNTPDNVPILPDSLPDNNSPDCTAIIPLPVVHMEPLAAVPINQKNKRSELSQRRIRRPFSVTEVEALVQAIEELGTGRWRDVKLRAFENADHRTYVDLKDKWKTLVHTASISPQQRRGEPVPQDLLDRVLSAHAYWSQHQGKQHGKHLPGPPKAANSSTDEGIRVGGT